MSFNLQEGSYIFRGDAYGVSARFDHPNKVTVPTQAQAVLAPTGGEAISRVTDFNFQEKIVFDEAIAHVVGTREDDEFYTDCTSTIRNLRFLQVHADIVNMRITSVHRRREKPGAVIDEAMIAFPGSRITGLVIAGHRIDVEWKDKLGNLTFEEYRKAYPKNKRVYGCGTVKESLAYDTLVDDLAGVKRLSDREAKTLLKDPEATLDDVRYFGNVVLVPEFGKIFIGEVLIERAIRRVNMLRIELGCGTGGGGSTGGGSGDGGDIPPETIFF